MATLNVNGKSHEVKSAPDTPLLWVLRDELGLTGTKYGCGMGVCGSCTVHLDGKATRACLTPLSLVADGKKKIVTIEALGGTDVGRAVEKAWIELDVAQCGYCQPGQCMTAAALLAGNRKPTHADVNEAFENNRCRCGTYPRIRQAIQLAVSKL